MKYIIGLVTKLRLEVFLITYKCGSMIFSRGRIFKNDFLSFPNKLKTLVGLIGKKIGKNCRQIKMKTGYERGFVHFLENFSNKLCSFWCALPSKIVKFGAKGSFRKVLGSVSQKWISQNST